MSLDGKLRTQFAARNQIAPLAGPPQPERGRIAKSYCILITPRSGSTWLSRRIERLAVLSCPDEFFNTEEFANTLKFNPGNNIREVFDRVAAKNCTNTGIFGFEISYFDLEEFEKEVCLLDVMPGERHFFYLNRRNFVAQAISLYTAVESRVFHLYDRGGEPAPSRQVPYDDDRILYWACHILQQEYGIRRWLARNRITPVRLCYEELREDIDGAVARIADALGVDLSSAQPRDVAQTMPITAAWAGAYEDRFRERHWEFCRKWEALRGTAPCPYDRAALAANTG